MITSYTEQELREREARIKAEAARKALADAAPDPQEFSLTGSSRAVDVAEANGQGSLF